MKNLFKIVLSYLLISFNTYVFSIESKNDNFLKIGVLAPFSGEFKDLGVSVLYSINLALHDIGDSSIKIYPKDSGSNKERIIKSCEEFRDEGIKIIIGPIDSTYIKELNNFNDLIFLSLSNIDSNFKSNVIMMGVNLESQLIAIKKFIEKNKKKKTVILYPNNDYKPSTYTVDATLYYNFKLLDRFTGKVDLTIYNLLDRLNENGVDSQTGRAYTAVIRETDYAGHRSDFNEYEDRIKNPSMFSSPRMMKLAVGINF